MKPPPSALELRFSQARIHLIADLPFFGSLAFRLKTELSTDTDTACTDGITVKINPAYAAKLTDPELAGLLVEEVAHCAYGHLWRRGTRDAARWNQAADQVLWHTIHDLMATTDGRVALSRECRPDERYRDLSTEEVYAAMTQDGTADPDYNSPGNFEQPAPGQSGQQSQSGQNQPDTPDPSGNPTSQPAPNENLEQEWKSATAQAAIIEQQRGQGKLPAALKQLITELVEPKIPWQDILREFCHRLSRDDYSFRRPNRRLLGHGFILPSLHSEGLGPIVLAFDTSGSIYGVGDLVRDILSEMQGILDACRPEKILLVACDAAIHNTAEFGPGDDLREFVPEGGGGTDFRPVFDLIDDLPEPPAALIYMTDLEGRFPDEAPAYPVLWANFGRPQTRAPFGHPVTLSI